MKKIINLSGIIVMALFLVQCSAPKATEEEPGHDEHTEGQEAAVVILNEVQVANAGIQTGSFDTLNVSGYIKANGNFDLPPENVAAITAPMQGSVKQANYLVGSHVNKGAVLAILAHPDYIKMQEDYLNTINNLNVLEAEYQRQKTLDSANIAARKSLQQAEAAYRAAMTKKLSLEKQLEYIGISPKQLADGQMSSTISIRAPFSGYISELNVHKGEFVRPEQELYEIINLDHMHLELNVYENALSKVKKGQPISFTVPSLGTDSYDGKVFLVGKSFDMESKTIRVHGHIKEMKPQFIKGLYLEASIFTGTEEVRALPEEAVIRDGGKTYIFIEEGRAIAHEETNGLQHDVHQGASDNEHAHEEDEGGHGHEGEGDEHGAKEGIQFRRVEVETGVRRNGMVEIRSIGDWPANAAIVTSGAYDLFSEMKKSEGGHHH